MTKKIITISRAFGSGGRSIGKEVAQRLGIPFYDKELVEAVARRAASMPTSSKRPENMPPSPAASSSPSPFLPTP